MNFTVRAGRIEDASSIASVQVESWRTTYAGIVPGDYLASLNPEVRAERWSEQFESGTNLILVAEDSSGVFGFASGGKLRDAMNGYDAELYAIYLLQREQKRGVGKMLVRKLAKGLRANGFRSLMVWVLAKNPAVGFYVRLGGSQMAQKEIEIGGVQLTEIAFGWANLDDLL